jgi:hypothetical protein
MKFMLLLSFGSVSKRQVFVVRLFGNQRQPICEAGVESNLKDRKCCPQSTPERKHPIQKNVVGKKNNAAP